MTPLWFPRPARRGLTLARPKFEGMISDGRAMPKSSSKTYNAASPPRATEVFFASTGAGFHHESDGFV